LNATGHVYTVAARLAAAVVPPPEPPSRPWSLVVEDPVVGPVRLSGLLSGPPPGAPEDAPARPRPGVLVVHGLGGSAESHYARRAAAAAVTAGWTCLRLNLRGADLAGEDIYHAGLTSDLHAALASPELAGCASLAALGFSLGGHLVLRMATEAVQPRLAAVAAVAAPLALAPCADLIDRPSSAVYRAYLLANLRRAYAAVAARRPVPVPVAAARRLRRIHDWDEAIVAPRHGFAGATDYYERASVAPRLGELRVPTLLVAAEDDPIVPVAAVLPVLTGPGGVPARLTVRWLTHGGHLGTYGGADLGLDSGLPPGARWEGQLLAWLAAR
jgi:predicted alpha/beta-fold hydrolase